PVPVRDVAPGIELSSTGLRIFDRRPITEVPELPMNAFAIAAAEDVPIAIETMLWLRSSTASSGPLRWNDGVRRSFFEILGRGRPGRSALEAMDHAGLLVRYVPDWEAVRCLPQHNVYHRFTVDVHLLTAVLEACRLGDPAPDGPDALAHEVWRDLADHKRVLLACLLHDIGKGREEDHSLLGEEIAARICAQMRLATEIAADVVWLVRNHLRLSDTATRRDTTDENLVVETAAWVGSAERLKMLYVVSVADGRATGPAAWNPWKAQLVGELFTKVLRVLEEGRLVGPDASDLVGLRATELRGALTRHPTEAVETHLAGMPRAYFLAFPTEALIRHFALMAAPPDGGPVTLHVGKTEAPGVYELDIVAPDRPGLISKVAGGLALNGVNVLAAQIFTRSDGAALEVFRVSGAHEDEVDPGRWDRVRADIGAAIAGTLPLDERLAEKRELYARPSKGKREPPRVLVENGASDFSTVVEVHATDRVGLLYAITDALSDLELDIHSARIATYAEDVVDVFYVRDVVGQKITDATKIREIERTVLERIGS
ncbi:MAG: ACT domain-containing protein, partial [Actinomycetota bacterium]